MKIRFSLIAGILLLSVSLNATERSIPYFVSTQWLADHSGDTNLVILQTAYNRKEYEFAHVPGARFLWFDWLAHDTPDLSTEMPELNDAKNILEQLGIAQNSRIVIVFGKSNVTTTTRMFLALSYFGLGDRAGILDGGLEMWKAEGRPISKETPLVKRTSIQIAIHPEVITNADWVKTHLASPHITIIDARSKGYYDGVGGGIARTGHIKGAKNIPFTTMADTTNRILPVAELQKLFDEAGVKKGDTVVTYCHVGQQATLVYTAARYLGYSAMVYDGCFEDWNVRDESYPVEKTVKDKK